MLEFFKRLWNQIQEAQKGLPASKKFAIAAVAVVMLLGILGVAYLSKKPEFHPLFTNLTPGDVSSITQNLTENGIPYKLAQDGSAIMVPSDRVHEVRLQLATEGLPTGGVVGFEIFDKSTFGMTEFVQKLNFKRALEGELSRTISQFGEIKSSRVHIAIPEKKLFTKEQAQTTASVVLKMASGRSLNKNQVMGIVHLVASSVENLKPENVTIVDGAGSILYGGEAYDEVARLSATQLDYRTNVERQLERRVTSMLENVVGPGKVVTRVSAEINFRRVERTEKKFDPDSQVARSEHRAESKSSGAQSPYGVPGAASNIPGGEGAGVTTGKPATSSKSDETINYEINEVVSHTVEPVGVLKKLSIAVMVDGKYEAKEGGAREYTPRTEEEIQRLTDVVRTAAGVDPERGDKVTVMSAPFDTSRYMAEIQEVETGAQMQLYADVIKFVGMGALAIALFIFVIRPILGWITASSAEIDTLRGFPETVRQMEARLGVTPEEEVDYRARVVQLMQENPKAAAEMIREWLRSRR